MIIPAMKEKVLWRGKTSGEAENWILFGMA